MADAADQRRLAEMLDKWAITELVHAYCNAADRHDFDKMRQLYHDDAIDEHGPFFNGPAMDFVDRLPEITAPMEILHHNVTTTNIMVDGDYGEGEIYIIAFHKARTEKGPVDVLIGGRYFDKYQKRDGIWKFSHRAVVADWVNVHDPSIVDLDDPFVAGSRFGKPGAEDPSYAFFTLLRRGER